MHNFEWLEACPSARVIKEGAEDTSGDYTDEGGKGSIRPADCN